MPSDRTGRVLQPSRINTGDAEGDLPRSLTAISKALSAMVRCSSRGDRRWARRDQNSHLPSTTRVRRLSAPLSCRCKRSAHPTFRKAVKSAACDRSARARNLPLSAPTYSRQRTESVTVWERGVSKSLPLSRTANLYVYPYWVRHNLSDDPAVAKTNAEVGAASCESTTRCEIGLAGGVACRFKRPTHQSSCGIAMRTEPSGGLA